MKQLKGLMYSLVQTKNAEGLSPAEQLRHARNYVFVTTDLQNSTAQASANPTAFLKIQEIHDTVEPSYNSENSMGSTAASVSSRGHGMLQGRCTWLMQPL